MYLLILGFPDLRTGMLVRNDISKREGHSGEENWQGVQELLGRREVWEGENMTVCPWV